MLENMFFNQYAWILFIAPFAGLLTAALAKRTDPVIRGNKILRHDLPARVSHWSHAIGTVVLLISGIILGTRLTPALNAGGEASLVWFNAHFVFACFFLYGTFFWLGDTIVSPHRLREHAPSKGALKSIIDHYGSLLKIKGCTYPREEKYFESERTAFLAAVGFSVLVMISGIAKALAHVFALPADLMGIVTWTHDIGAFLMLLVLLVHVFFGVLIPIAWKAAPSMIHGYIDLEDARHEFPAWVEKLEKEARADSAPNASREKGTSHGA